MNAVLIAIFQFDPVVRIYDFGQSPNPSGKQISGTANPAAQLIHRKRRGDNRRVTGSSFWMASTSCLKRLNSFKPYSIPNSLAAACQKVSPG